jgi:hypothetical protein
VAVLWLMRLSTSSSRSKRSAVRPRRWPPCSCCSGYQALSSEARLLALDPTLQVGGLGSRVPDGLAMLAAGFYPASQPQTAEAQRQP